MKEYASKIPAYFVVRFDVDDCVASVQPKRILNVSPVDLLVGDTCTVKCTDGNYAAVVLATGTGFVLNN